MKIKRAAFLSILSILFIFSSAGAEWMKEGEKSGHDDHMRMIREQESGDTLFVDIKLHDEVLLTRNGEKVKFVSDVIGDRIVAVTFIYTNCTTICPIFQAIFADMQKLLGERLGKDVVLLTMSLDPARDIPPRMKIEAQKWYAKPDWYHLTGRKPVMDKVLQGLDAYFADFTQHPPMAMVGDGKSGKWKRYNGFPKPEELLAMIDEFKMAREGGHHHEKAERGEQKAEHEMHHKSGHGEHHKDMHDEDHGEHHKGEHEKHHKGHDESKAERTEQRAEKTVTEEEKAREYFTDLPVVDQDGNRLRFYSDVLKGRVVLITMYYTDCGLACPVTMQKLKDVEAIIGDRLGDDIFFVGLSVDSGKDTPELVKEFLVEYEAYKKGYIFLSGEQRVVDHIIYKLGQYRPDIEYHSTMMIMGNVKTGHWAKVNPTYPSSSIGIRLKMIAGEDG